MGINSSLVSNVYFGGPGENAQWLSQLSIEKRTDEVVSALQRHFPFIRTVTPETVFGVPIVYADLPELPRKLPLSLVSSGISRLFTFILCIVQQKKGIVLVDEIENGIFHDQYQMMWKTLADLARSNDTQLFVSTHSKECLRSAVPTIAEAPNDFALLRIRRERAQTIGEIFGGEMIQAALEKNGEVRD
jgi:predicted ATPase